MSLTANISPANMALTGNPIKLSINSSSLATYIISIGNQEIFTGSGEGNFFIFIQEILANVVQPAQIFCFRQKTAPRILLLIYRTTMAIRKHSL